MPGTTELARLDDQLRRSLSGEAWHGPTVLELLTDVTADAAAAHPVEGAHSIWELVLHLRGAYSLVLRRLAGDGRELAAEEDWPPVPEPSPDAWRAAVADLERASDAVRRAVAGLAADRLDAPLVSSRTDSAYVQILGLTQHDAYHAGQIALLKRAMRPTPG